MDKFIKRLQTRASRKGISVSKSQVREVYTQVVVTPEAPTDQEILSVIEQLEKQYLAPSHEVSEDELTIPQPQIIEITPESRPEVWEIVQPPTEQPTVTPQQEPQQMTATQPTNSTLATSSQANITQASSANLSLTQQQIQEAVELQFGSQSQQTKEALVNYAFQRTFKDAGDLRLALEKVAQLEKDAFLKIISDFNATGLKNRELYESALKEVQAKLQGKDADFFGSLESQLLQMRVTFGI